MYWFTGILGLVLAFAPWVFGYANNTAALWTSVLVGAATLLVSWIEGFRDDREGWEYWAAIVLGLVAIVAPFALRFATVEAWTSVVVGVLLILGAGGRIAYGQPKLT